METAVWAKPPYKILGQNEQPRPKGRGIRRVRVVYHHVVLCMLYAASGEELNPKLIKINRV